MTGGDRTPGGLPPSPWLTGHLDLLPAAGLAVDVACGTGRHTRLLLERGYRVVAVDRDVSGLADLVSPALTVIATDLEDGTPWPFAAMRFQAVVVSNYLHRPLLPALVAAVAPGGVLVYETFAAGNERFGRPSNPDFLLRPGELLDAVAGRLRVLAYEDLIVDRPKRAAVQRIVAAAEPVHRPVA